MSSERNIYSRADKTEKLSRETNEAKSIRAEEKSLVRKRLIPSVKFLMETSDKKNKEKERTETSTTVHHETSTSSNVSNPGEANHICNVSLWRKIMYLPWASK